ncbi:hypothetical protein ACTND8_08460 [Atopobiaceae bacterium HCP3S3_F7]
MREEAPSATRATHAPSTTLDFARRAVRLEGGGHGDKSGNGDKSVTTGDRIQRVRRGGVSVRCFVDERDDTVIDNLKVAYTPGSWALRSAEDAAAPYVYDAPIAFVDGRGFDRPTCEIIDADEVCAAESGSWVVPPCYRGFSKETLAETTPSGASAFTPEGLALAMAAGSWWDPRNASNREGWIDRSGNWLTARFTAVCSTGEVELGHGMVATCGGGAGSWEYKGASVATKRLRAVVGIDQDPLGRFGSGASVAFDEAAQTCRVEVEPKEPVQDSKHPR